MGTLILYRSEAPTVSPSGPCTNVTFPAAGEPYKQNCQEFYILD